MGGLGINHKTGPHLIHLCPEPGFQPFLGLLQRLVLLHQVQMGEHAHDLRETVHLG